jgi:Toprim domain
VLGEFDNRGVANFSEGDAALTALGTKRSVTTALSKLGIVTRECGTTEQRVPCPKCDRGPRDDALGVNIETGAFHCFRCGWKGRAASDCNSWAAARIQRIDDSAIAERKRERLRKIWRETNLLTDQRAWAVRRYLESRALAPILAAPPAALRAHSGVEYWDATRLIGRFPAMVALFVNPMGAPVTLHITYLRADGTAKAAVPSPKKILGVSERGATKGGAIRLHEPREGRRLGVAEGIESALSMHLLQRVPVWSSYCADNLQHVQLPDRLRALYIGVDLDANGKGEAVAQALAERVNRTSPHTRTFIVLPELDGVGDLNDELRRRASGRR